MAQEMTKFNNGEFKDIKSYTQDGEKEYMIKVKKHKTMIYGGAEIIMNIYGRKGSESLYALWKTINDQM